MKGREGKEGSNEKGQEKKGGRKKKGKGKGGARKPLTSCGPTFEPGYALV